MATKDLATKHDGSNKYQPYRKSLPRKLPTCDICLVEFDQPSEMKAHIIEKHGVLHGMSGAKTEPFNTIQDINFVLPKVQSSSRHNIPGHRKSTRTIRVPSRMIDELEYDNELRKFNKRKLGVLVKTELQDEKKEARPISDTRTTIKNTFEILFPDKSEISMPVVQTEPNNLELFSDPKCDSNKKIFEKTIVTVDRHRKRPIMKIISSQSDALIDTSLTSEYSFSLPTLIAEETGDLKSQVKVEDDEFDTFSKYIATEMRGLTEQQRNLAKIEIPQLFYRIRCLSQHLTANSPETTVPQTETVARKTLISTSDAKLRPLSPVPLRSVEHSHPIYYKPPKNTHTKPDLLTKSAYACFSCEHKTDNKGSLFKHVTRLHEKVKFQCDQCLREFAKKSLVRIHLMKQHQELHLTSKPNVSARMTNGLLSSIRKTIRTTSERYRRSRKEKRQSHMIQCELNKIPDNFGKIIGKTTTVKVRQMPRGRGQNPDNTWQCPPSDPVADNWHVISARPGPTVITCEGRTIALRLSVNHDSGLMSELVQLLSGIGEWDKRGCRSNKKNCECNGDPSTGGNSKTFGCTYASYWYGCRNQETVEYHQRFRLTGIECDEQRKQMESRIAELISGVGIKMTALLRKWCPGAFETMTKNLASSDCKLKGTPFTGVTLGADLGTHVHRDGTNVSNGLTILTTLLRPDKGDLRRFHLLHGFGSVDGKKSGLAIELKNGDVLIEPARWLLHSNPPLKSASCKDPSCLAIVFYQHRQLENCKHDGPGSRKK